MSLSLYNKKRHFDVTSEPEGKKRSSKGSLRFVVQKHDASHVHYDFRLEMSGTLKSWAIPKGPSLNPADKRLAMMVEDHPYDYKDFEGIIPAGSYGGGTVIVWDEGTYIPIGGEGLSQKEQEKILLKQLYSGNLKIVLHGKKLKGEFALFQMKARGERSWILVKHRDQYASEKDITLNEKSVKTGKTLVQVAKANGTEVNHPEAHGQNAAKTKSDVVVKKAKKKAPALKPTKITSSKKKVKNNDLLKGLHLPKTAMPVNVDPMLATLVDEPFDNESWLFEIKWDGYRAITYADGNNVELISRNDKSFTERYEPVTEAIRLLDLHAVFDGEIIAVNEKGMADFQVLQNWQNTPATLKYYIFDILWLDGYNLTSLPLIERKKILQKVLPEENDIIKYSDHIVGKGKEFFQAAVNQGLEGIMAKNGSGVYQVATRSKDWLKVKVSLRQEVVIAGYTMPRNTRKYFGSLLLGVYDEEKLIYVGHTGSGFNTESLGKIFNKLQSLITDKCPFQPAPKTNMPATWVKPKLVCEIKFTEWTKDRIARHPIFMGLRVDKKANSVTFEKAIPMSKIEKDSKKQSTKKNADLVKPSKTIEKNKPEKKSSRKLKESPSKIKIAEQDDQIIIVDKHELKLTNLGKVYWKKEGFTKGNMINYYLEIAPYIFPYLKDRPQSLNRYPNGIAGQNFYQKDVEGKVPSWMQTHKNFSESTNETIQYLVCSNEASLIYMANLGCIEMHPWHSRVQSPDNPDWCLIDLDPDNNNSYDQVVDTALVIKKILDSIGAESYPKTSGSTGLHIFIPLGAKYSYEQSKQLAELVVNLANQELPSNTSVIRNPQKRKGKIYLDFLQNRQTQTAAAPYSLRPKAGVPVSTPLDWSEVKKGLTASTYTAFNIFERLKKEGDLFSKVLSKGINLEKVLNKLQSLLK